MADGKVTDTTRIDAFATIRELSEKGAKQFLLAHFSDAHGPGRARRWSLKAGCPRTHHRSG